MKTRPNILFAFADDFGRYASSYEGVPGAGEHCSFVKTPHIDRIAREGVLFSNALVPAPTCTPCRSSLLSGRYFWQTRLGAILAGAVFDSEIPTWPLELEKNGYHIGFTYKVWGPGVALDDSYAGRKNCYVSHGQMFNEFSFHGGEKMERGLNADDAKLPLYDEVRGNFRDFLSRREGDKPFAYWWGPTNTHRHWKKGSGKTLWDIDPDGLEGHLPSFFPDVPEIRQDVSDYLGECQAFDGGLGVLLEELETLGELDNTLVVVSGDHGIPGFPRAKCNLYSIGCEVILTARLPGRIPEGRQVSEMVNLFSLAPAFLEIGDTPIPEGMIAPSILPFMTGERDLYPEREQAFVITGRERHVAHARQWNLPYPMRAIRTPEFTYIRNFKPDRWPAGDPRGMDDPGKPPLSLEQLETDTYAAYADCDASPTKAWMIHHRGEKDHRGNFLLGFDRRPEEELYRDRDDPDQLNNLAYDPSYASVKEGLKRKLITILADENDPRLTDEDCRFEHSPYTDLKMNGEAYRESLPLSILRLSQS